MFGWIGKLFGSDKAATSLIDNISNGLDKLHYGDQERAEDRAKAVREGNKVYMQWLQGTSGSRIARRFIAITVTLVWASQYVLSLFMSCLAPWMSDPKVTENLMSTSEVLQANGEQGNAAFMIVLGFYFLGNKADQMFEAAVNKFTSKHKENK